MALHKFTLSAALISGLTLAMIASLSGCSSKDRHQDQNKASQATAASEHSPAQDGITADSQASSATEDVEMTRRIRRAIIDKKDLSVNAHNIKIITMDGNITLKGAVKSASEQKMVESLARQASGKSEITNETYVTK